MMDRSIDRHDLPIGIAHAATVKHGHYAVTFGGMSSNNGQFVSSSRIVLTDLETGHSTFAGKLPLGIHDPAAVAVSASRSIVFGGWDNAVSAAQASIIDLNNKSELSVTPFALVESRSYATGHSTEDGKVIVVGGLHRPRESQVLNLSSVERIDISRKSSEYWTYMHQPRRYHLSRKIGNYIYVLGGTGVNKMGRPPALSSIERIDLNSGEVKVVGSLLQPRYHCQSFALDYNGRSYVCVFGGQSDSETAVRTLEVFDCWSAKSHLLSTLPIEIIDHDKITVCLGNKVYVVGGESLSTDMGQNSLLEIEFQGSSRCYRA